MKILVLCLMVVGHTLAAPNKRDVEYYGYIEVPAEYGAPEYGAPEYGPPKFIQPVESTTHYCPEEDIQAKFIPSPPEIQSFPLPELQVVPVVKQEFAPYPSPALEYGPPVRQVVIEEVQQPFEEYGPPAYDSFAAYGLPRQEIPSTEAPSTEAPTTLPPTTEAPTEPPITHTIIHRPTTESPLHHKLGLIKSYISNYQPKIVIYKKKIEFPFLKKLFKFNHH